MIQQDFYTFLFYFVETVGCWYGYLSWARYSYGPADATAIHCLLFQYNPDWFTFGYPLTRVVQNKGP